MEIRTIYTLSWVVNGATKEVKDVKPYYKSVKKTYKKESNQAFFREAFEGKMTLFGEDYDFVNQASIDDTFYMSVSKGQYSGYIGINFNKTDCKFNHAKKSVELSFTYSDKYTKVMDKYENTYDLLKIAPKISSLEMTKRTVVQIYIKGEETISSYSAGTYWETDVNEVIDSEDALRNKYFFSKGPSFGEIDIEKGASNVSTAISADGTMFVMDGESDTWNCVSPIGDGTLYIKFVKENSIGDDAGQTGSGYLMSTGKSGSVAKASSRFEYEYIYDMYKIEIWSNLDNTAASPSLVARSKNAYAKDTVFTIAVGQGLYEMVQSNIGSFYLGEHAVNYDVWGRLLCDSETSSDGSKLYDLPYDDFANDRANYKKCIGLIFSNSVNSICHIYQSVRSTDTPNNYGINDSRKYFIPPYDPANQVFYPVARSSWANTSLWIKFADLGDGVPQDFITWCAKFDKKYTLRNAYHIADVISALLSQISPNIKHEAASEYSKFLYGQTDGLTRGSLGGCQIYIAPKSNILKGEYDQAAQKAEITLKQVMDMLRDCYRCYWYIDDKNRLIIEHVTYFMNGLSYSAPGIQFDLTNIKDRFNQKSIIYAQREIEYDKSELYSRYEFAWSDDVTDAMGNLSVDVNDEFVKKDNKSDINIDNFCSDIDYMLFMPGDFSSDGFALIMAKNNKVPIVRLYLKYDKYYNATMPMSIQNWYASFNNLINHYLYDMPGKQITYTNVRSTLVVSDIKRCMTQDITFMQYSDPDVYQLVKTYEGDGCIEEMSIDINSGLINMTLSYKPK